MSHTIRQSRPRPHGTPLDAARPQRCTSRRGARDLLRHVFPAVMLALALSLPSGVQAEDHLDAAMAIVVPPDPSEVEKIIQTMALRGDAEATEALRAQLLRLYRSDEFRQRTARVYAKYLSEDELRYLAETFQHPVFRRYRALAPDIMLELAELERDLFASMQP